MKANWSFVRAPAITAEESDYLIEAARKNLKLAFELEYNIRGVDGHCSGNGNQSLGGGDNSNFCHCANHEKFNCQDRCAVSHICMSVPSRPKCQKHIDGSCKFSEYPKCPSDCDRFEWTCIGGDKCTDFEAPCNHGCIYYRRDCTSCGDYVQKNDSPSAIRDRAVDRFNPSESIDLFGETGVEKIVKDSSLINGGIEVCTVGRRFNALAMLRSMDDIVSFCRENGAYVNFRCSMHNHILFSYYPHIDVGEQKFIGHMTVAAHKNYAAGYELTDLERPVPSVVLANYIQLVRRFTPELVWISSSGASKKSLTRWEKYRCNFVDLSPLNFGIEGFINAVKEKVTFYKEHDKGKYGFINFNHIVCDEEAVDGFDKPIKRFHLESRYSDGMLSPVGIVAIAALNYALVLKAIRISRYGVLEAFDYSSFAETTQLTEAILNRNPKDFSGPRTSDTSSLFKDGLEDIIRRRALNMVNMLKPEIAHTGGFDRVLSSLAETPCSLRICKGKNWDTIDFELRSFLELDAINPQVEEIVDLIAPDIHAKNFDDWIVKAMGQCSKPISKEEIQIGLDKLIKARKINWDELTGTFNRT